MKMYVILSLFLLTTFLLDWDTLHAGKPLVIPMGTNCAPFIVDLFLFGYERDFMVSVSLDTQCDAINAFNNTSSYLDDILNIDNPFFDSIICKVYPPELTLVKANPSDVEAPFLELLTISNGYVNTKIYDKRDNYDF